MTSRRSFLISCSSVPLLPMANNLFMAKTSENTTILSNTPIQLNKEDNPVDMGIYGWHEPNIDASQTTLISLTASWKADWL